MKFSCRKEGIIFLDCIQAQGRTISNSQKTDGTQLGVILKREYLGLVEAKGNTDSSHDSLEDATMDDLVGHGNTGGRNCKNIGGGERNNFRYNRDGDNNCAFRGGSQKCICTSNN
nr:uncharacterized protein LOC127296310 [Lolium perenne]